mgnify:CR=1 FL=1
MRGKVGAVYTLRGIYRITPAHAGKSVENAITKAIERDHPRTCGEKFLIIILFPLLLGSPPHMRGKEFCELPLHFCLRITPAHAGKSICVKTDVSGVKDHPRTCGEKTEVIML